MPYFLRPGDKLNYNSQNAESSTVGLKLAPITCSPLTSVQVTDVSRPGASYKIITGKHCLVIEQSSNQELLSIGIFAEVYLLDGKTIRKAPRSEKEEDTQPIVREATIYNILGDHPRIARCISQGRMNYVDIQYYSHGDLAKFRQEREISPGLQKKWFQQMIEAIVAIHHFDIIHSDLALRQFFIDDDYNLRLGDFNSSQYPGHPALGYEKATHCLPRDYGLPNTKISDLFALGSTLYEFVTGQVPYSELYPVEPKEVIQSSDPDTMIACVERQHLADTEVEKRYTDRVFPDVSNIFRGDIIQACWNGSISSAEEALHLYVHGS